MQDVFAALRQTMRRGESLRLLYGSQNGQVGIFFGGSSQTTEHVSQLVASKYPNCAVQEVQPPGLDLFAGKDFVTVSAELTLSPSLFPILRYEQFEDLAERKVNDPIEMLLAAVQADELRSLIELVVAPASPRQHRIARRLVKILDHSFFRQHFGLASLYAKWITHPRLWLFVWPLQLFARGDGQRFDSKTDTTAARQGDRTDDVQAASDKAGGHLYNARLRVIVYCRPDQVAQARRKIEGMRAAFASFTISRLALFERSKNRVRRGPLPPLVPSRRRSFFLSHCELATLFHPATASAQGAQMARLPFTELPAPVQLASGVRESGVVLGRVRHRNDERIFGLEQEDRRRHLYVVGKTGMGKTTLLECLIRSDIERGHGVCLVDPHGDLADKILAAIPTHRTNDVILFDPSDPEYAIGFNPLSCRPGWEDRVTSGVVSSFKKLYDSWGPRLEDTLRNATYLAVENGGTLVSILDLLTRDAARAQLLLRNSDDLARRFWIDEFPRWNDRYRTEAVASILNKIRPFLMNRQVRSVVSQSGRSLDLREVMDERRILIVNVSKGKLGEDNANLLGALLVSSLQQAAMSRADVAEENRRDFYLYIDEFQNFSTGAFAQILSEARKYRLNMTIAHQYTRQLDEQTADAVFGNVGSMIVFQVGSDDAEILVRQVRKHPNQIAVEDLTNLPKYHAYVRLLQNGMPENPFSMSTLPPQAIEIDRSALVRRVSNARYARPKYEASPRVGFSSSEAPEAPIDSTPSLVFTAAGRLTSTTASVPALRSGGQEQAAPLLRGGQPDPRLP